MTGRAGREVRLFGTALMLLTRLPISGLSGFQEDWLPRSSSWFPLVGALVGGIASGVFFLASFFWSGPIPILLAVAAAAWVTGGLHEDGWADTFDGFAAGRTRERILAVMKDSRIGAAGALGLILLVAAKLFSLTLLSSSAVPAALVAAHVLSRWSSVPLMWGLSYARPEGGMAGPLAGRVSLGRLIAGTLLALLIVIPLLRWEALPASLSALAVVLLSGLFFQRRLGGITGDCLGAVNQLVELAVFLALSAHGLAPR